LPTQGHRRATSQDDDDPNPPRPFRHLRDLVLKHRQCHRPFRRVRENRVISRQPARVGEMRGEQLLAHAGVGKAKVKKAVAPGKAAISYGVPVATMITEWLHCSISDLEAPESFPSLGEGINFLSLRCCKRLHTTKSGMFQSSIGTRFHAGADPIATTIRLVA